MAHNAKKALMVDERYESIERENRQLLGRLQHIMLHDQGQAPPPPNARRVGPVSMNEDRRRREQHKVMRENEVRAARRHAAFVAAPFAHASHGH